MPKIHVNYSPYRSAFSVHQQRINHDQQKTKVTAGIKVDINPYLLMGILLLFSVVLSGLYLMHFNTVATKGYELKKLELVRKELQSQSDLRNMYLAEAQSMATILGNDRLDRMRKPAELQFIYNDTVIAQVD